MHQARALSDRSTGWETRALFLGVLLVAACLRLWRLEVPSLWFDEILVAMAADLPMEAVLDRVNESDIHPPFFHLLTKLVMTIGRSDDALRLPAALLGMAGVWLCWRIGRALASERIGLAMAAVCATLPWLVLLSRQVRPYALIFFFCMLSFFFLARAVREGRVRDAALAGLSLWPPVLVYYGALLPAGGAGCVLLASWASGRTGWRHVLAFAALTLVPATAVLPFLLAALGHEQGVTQGADRLSLAWLCLEKLGHLLFRQDVPLARAALATASAVGLALIWRRDRSLALVGLGWLLFPLAALVAVGYGSYFNPWHLVVLLPPLVVWLGAALAAVPWATLPAAVCAAAFFFTLGQPLYFQADSHGGDFKAKARALATAHSPGTVFVYPESAVTSPLNWYLDQFAKPNPLRAQHLGPQDTAVRIVVPGASFPSRTLARTPVLAMGVLPFRTRVTCAPDDVLSRVYRLDHLACQPVLEEVMVASQANRTGIAEFVFENDSPAPQNVTVHFGFSNRKPGNRFYAKCRFDDEPWAATFESLGPDARGHEKIEVRRGEPYRFLTVRFELERDGRSPAFTGEDLEAVRFLDFKLEVGPEKK